MSLSVLSVASELFPLVKTGGLADVAGALPAALGRQGIVVRTLLPGYPAVLAGLADARPVATVEGAPGGTLRLIAGRTAEDTAVVAIEAPDLYDRPGNPYLDTAGIDWPDNHRRFATLAWIAARIGREGLDGWRPDIVHAHDWQAGLAPAYLTLAGGIRPATVLTVHNLAFQGLFPAGSIAGLGLDPAGFAINGYESWGHVGFLKAGLYYADRLTTVSPTYAREIQGEAEGMGLHGLLQARRGDLVGITNGIDETVWDPAADPHLPFPFDASTLTAKAGNKKRLQERLGLAPEPGALLLAVVSRLTEQKGLDLLLTHLPVLLARGGQLALLGSGQAWLEAGFRAAASAHPRQVGAVFGYDEPLAHLIQGGSDAILVPSRFEPCGLTQLCALRYGTVPVVARVGGLADTIVDANEAALADAVATGIQFAPVTAEAFAAALDRAFALWSDPPVWRRLQIRGMSRNVGWQPPAARYKALYESLLMARSAAA